MAAGTERIPRHIRILLAANFVSVLGSGLTLPFLLIYLHEVRHIALGITGLLIGGTAVVGIPVGPATGVLVDRFGPRVVCASALVLDAIGALGLISVHSPLSALPVMFVYGLANGSTWPAWNALFAVMVEDEHLRPRVFARNFQMLNLGLGLGSVIAGLVVHVSHPRSFELIYLIDGATYFSIVAALVLLPASAFARSHQQEHSQTEVSTGGYREVLADRRFIRYLVASGLMMFAGYAAVDTGLVGYATVVIHVGPRVIAVAFAVNTGLIVAIQPIALRLVGRMRRSTALSICAAFFGTSWVILAIGGVFPRSLLGGGLTIAMFGVFALGEVLLAPVGGPLVTMMARTELQGRYSATSSSVYTVTSALCRALAGALLGAGLGDVFLGILVGCCVASMFGFAWMARLLSPAIDNVRSVRSNSAL
jgi:Na+/melibiose symporter-like transporter